MRPPTVPSFALSRPGRVSRPGSAAVSVLFHAILIFLLVYPTTRFLQVKDPGNDPFSALGGGGGGGGGSEAVAYISLPAFRPPPPVVEEAVVPPVETPVVPAIPEPTPVQDSVDRTELATADSASQAGEGTKGDPGPGSGGGTGGGDGPGTGTGTGPGSGPGSGGMGTEQLPRWRQAIMPPENPPRELRGQTITIIFSIRADGRVERVEFSPEIRNRDYATKFRERLLSYVFIPARSAAGIPIAAEYPISFKF